MNTSVASDADRERLSALADGELDPVGIERACDSWRTPELRRAWHEYQLIGDVLRSDDLATACERDAAFLAVLRERLAAEPVVLAPTALVSSAGGGERSPAPRRRWVVSGALAAGVLMVVGVIGVVRDTDAPARLADATGLASPVRVASGSVPAGAGVSPASGVVDPVIRDERLDRYLAAHRQFAGTSMLGASSVFVRSASADGGRR